MMRVAGIDISLRNIGVCKFDLRPDGRFAPFELTLIQPPSADKRTQKQVRKNSDDLRRARFLHNGLTAAIEDCGLVIVEMPVGSQSARAMSSYGICVGILASIDKPFIEVTPQEVKLAGHGTKNATKAEMIRWAHSLYPQLNWKTRKQRGEIILTADNEHLADAIAAFHAGIQTNQFRIVQQMAKRLS